MGLVSFLFSHLPSPNSQLAEAAEEPQVRVAILQDVPSCRVTIFSPCRFIDLASGELLSRENSLLWKEVKSSDRGLSVGPSTFPVKALLVEPEADATVRINARPYRGSLILYLTEKGFTVVNRLDLEEYLVSALGSETNPDWPIEALKAHAVVSRTMIAHRVWISKGKPFDATADTSTHLYHGMNVERSRVREAVEETRGQVLTYKGELLSVTFHANCGGHTEDSSEIWEGKGDLSPLEGRPDPYCRELRHYRWKWELSQPMLMQALRGTAGEIGGLKVFQILDRNRSGRVRTVRLVGTKGSAVIPGRKLRELLGPNRLRSLNFTVDVTPQKVSFSGFGWGHGVGLCQWGAYGQAQRGRTMDEILAFYFPTAHRRKLRGLPGFSSL